MQELYTAAAKEAGVVEFDEETGETPEEWWEIVDSIDEQNEETLVKIYDLEDRLFTMEADLSNINAAKEEEARLKKQKEEIALAAKLKIEKEAAEAKALKLAEEAAKKAAEEKAKRDAEIAAAKAAEEEAARKAKELKEKLAAADKSDPEWIRAREEFVRQETELMMQRLYKSYAEAVEKETNEFYTQQEKAYAKIEKRKESLSSSITKMRTELDLMWETQNVINEKIWSLQEQIQEATNEKEVVKIIDKLKEIGAELTTAYKDADKLQTQIGKDETTLYGLDVEQHLTNRKTEADYMALYVSRLKEEITKRTNEKKAAEGTEDEDLVTAQSKAAIEYYNNELSWREPHAKELLKWYTQERKDRDQVIENETTRTNIQREQSAVNA